MPTAIDPEMTAEERRAALLAGAQAAIVAARDAGDAALVERLGGLYSRCAAYLKAYAARQRALVAFEAADRAFREQCNPPHGHDDDVHVARSLDVGTVSVMPLDLFDGERDADALLAGAALFADLAEACRR